ncbi:hypothetical protein Bbelb_302250 [Branchiostoma belcheri]|nr:hypothetical protein Bbelb_302250 [Branchiostoma belcheri]
MSNGSSTWPPRGHHVPFEQREKVVRSTAPGVDSPHKKAYRGIIQSNTFLIRGLKTTGRKAELRALAYSAVQFGIPVKQDEIAEDRARSTQYAELLKVNDTKLPDALLDLTEGWLKEKDAVDYGLRSASRTSPSGCCARPRASANQETAALGRIGRQQHCTIVSSATTKTRGTTYVTGWPDTFGGGKDLSAATRRPFRRGAEKSAARADQSVASRRQIRRHADLSAARADISAVRWRYQVSPSCFQ